MGLSPNSPPSTHTPGDGMVTSSSLQHVNSVSKSFMYGADGAGGIASSTNQLVYLNWLSVKFIMCMHLISQSVIEDLGREYQNLTNENI